MTWAAIRTGSIAEVGLSSVAAATVNIDLKHVSSGHMRHRRNRDHREVEVRYQVAPNDGVHALHHTRRHQLAGASGRRLLGVLEDEYHLSRQLLAYALRIDAVASSWAVCAS